MKITTYYIGKPKTEMQQGYQAIRFLLGYYEKDCWPFAPIYILEHHLLIIALNFVFFQ